MARKHSWLMTVLVTLPLGLALGCSGNFGKVEQGRVIAYDKDRKMVTVIKDVGRDSKNPDYTALPPVTFALPTDPKEMGPEPKAGKRMKLDTQNRQIVVYVPTLTNFAKINYTLIDQKENVGDKDPLVYDSGQDKPKKFPAVDQYKKTITIYSKRQKTVTTFSVPDEYFSLPEDTWDNGDEVRIYTKEDGKAARFMNVSKTDIYKK